ncbi:MAG: 5-formyltetrahydrofolate cyclo-ligase [Burkholderiales bacterium]|nr:5-formyltetrahydrofolate cyclo-ligase [Burkholderiales bacterium]
MTDKAALRRELRRKRAALPKAQRQAAERAFARHAGRLIKRGQRVAMYLAAGSELSLSPLIARTLARGIPVYLPIVPRRGRVMQFTPLGAPGGAWHFNRFGIREYQAPARIAAHKLDLVFVPLVGFDATRARLGQGGGFYDTTFAFRRLQHNWRKPKLIGAAFALQQVAHIPAEPHDARLDMVLTEHGPVS